MSSSEVNLEKFLIPLADIRKATQNFSQAHQIGEGSFGPNYKGELCVRGDTRTVAIRRLKPHTSHNRREEFLKQVEMVSSLKHENIVSFIGYCDEDNEMIAVSEIVGNGSLDDYLHDPDRRRFLTWAQRLKICLGIAQGLEYLHSGLGEDIRVIHRGIKSRNILIDYDVEAKISDAGVSLLVNKNQPQVYKRAKGTNFYTDPIYKASGFLNTELDVYSFGMILFEMLTGMLAHVERVFGDDAQPQRLVNLVRRYEVENLVDPLIKEQINLESLATFKEIAYQCISWNLKDRPMMNTIITKIQEALNIQDTNTIRSYQPPNLKGFLIPLEEIQSATQDFSSETQIRDETSAIFYRGQLRECTTTIKRLNRENEFRNELEVISSFQHQNITAFIGYCDEANERIIVYEDVVNGSLDHHLRDPDKGCRITWSQRLKICLGAARGLEYLHSGVKELNTVIHRDIKSANILLDDNLEAKIYDFGLSQSVNPNKPKVYHLPASTSYYTDPIYGESGIVNKELDVYSFGVVLLELLSGTLAYNQRSIDDDEPQTLINLFRRYHDDNPNILIDPFVKDQINFDSLHVLIKIIFACINYNIKKRPTMKWIVNRIKKALESQNKGATPTKLTQSRQDQDPKNFQIPLTEIIFKRTNFIGDGGFGNVYKGQYQNITVAIKCLNKDGQQGREEFRNEVELLSTFQHQNIIPFVGYCDEGDEMIIVSEYAVNGSIDHYLRDPSRRNQLTWTQRLKICLGAAKGLDYLHSGLGKYKRVIHRDVKSANILLDKNLEAKICDFGLSKRGPRNQQHTQINAKAAGTRFYMDPAYAESDILSKESDVYSFGVVLFEMLSGRLAYSLSMFKDGNQLNLIQLVRRYYDEPKKLIDRAIKDEIGSHSFNTFKEIAYQCINLNSKERPTMNIIIDRLEDAIDLQELEPKKMKS